MTQARILVVDDTPRNLKLLADVLSAEGHVVSAATSGAEALERIAAERLDLVLLDVVMPGMSGYEVCRAIRANPATRWLPVIMVTALEASEERVTGLDAGADDFISKPISRPELLARVRSLLRIKQLYDTVDDQARQLAAWNERLERRVDEQVEELERMARLKRFLPPEIAERVVEGGTDDPLTSHRREIAVVCLELRGFTAFAETAAPEEVMSMLQELHDAMGRLVLEHQGTLERFTSEGMTVFFNDPISQPDAAERAVRLALAIRARGAELSAHWEKRGVDVQPGIGVSQGYATLGAIGFEVRSDYAAIGAVTHLAARLSETAAPGEILATQRVLAELDGAVESEPAGERTLRGFGRPLATFRILGTRDAKTPATTPDDVRVFRREGEYWTLAFAGESFRLRDAKGLRYIAHLLGHPERAFHALDLVALARAEPGEPAPVSTGDLPARGLGDAGPVLDAQAKSAYRSRLLDLWSQLPEAEANADAGRIDALRNEIDALSDQLAAAVGLGGRDRRVGSAAERGRVSVTRAISDAIKRVREHSPALARYLDAAIRTGTFCVYRPPGTATAWLL
jgi:CheY-like chemotaxis protein/class 3 adenylate cyclase